MVANDLRVGVIVHYVLTESDVRNIQEQRKLNTAIISGNTIKIADHVAMVVTKIWVDEFAKFAPDVNGRCLLDGIDSLWITGVKFSEKKLPGTWHWIER